MWFTEVLGLSVDCTEHGAPGGAHGAQEVEKGEVEPGRRVSLRPNFLAQNAQINMTWRIY